jgi:hypothetical protein
LRTASTRFKRLPGRLAIACGVAALAAASLPAMPSLLPVVTGTEKTPANELTLSGLRPGRDTRATAVGRHHKPSGASDERTATWRDPCRGRDLRMEFGENDVVESITVSVTPGPHDDCRPGTPAMTAETWRTGRGLSLGDLRERVVTLYGQPDSRGPSTREGEETEFLYYPFDWAGSDVPQVLEVTCDKKNGRVVQMTLAGQSL